MALFKAKALVNGTETEVELDDTKVITVEQASVRTKETVRQRLSRQAVNLRGELLKDGDFIAEVLTSKGVDPKTLKPAESTGKPLTEGDVARLQEEWTVKHLKPVQEQLTAANTRFESSNARTLEADLTRALGENGVDKAIANRIAKMEMSRFGFDDKSGRHALKNGEAFAFSTQATEEMPFKGVDEFAKEWAADSINAPFVKRQTQDGPNLGGEPRNGAPAGGKRSEMSAAQQSQYIDKHGFDAFSNLPM